MNMQDNEFDDFFKSELKDFEVSPSAEVWNGINSRIEKDKRKKLLIPIYSIAASILVLIMFGVFYLRQFGVNSNVNVKNNELEVKNINANPQPLKIVSGPTVPKNGTKVFEVVSIKPVKDKPGLKVRPSIGNPGKSANPDTLSRNTDSANSIEQITDVPDRGIAIKNIKPVVPDSNIRFSIPQLIVKAKPIAETPNNVLAQNPVLTAPKTEILKTKPKIRSLGGFINAMVARVDKRKDKFIEFTESEDGSNITGVNLGIIKIKKDTQNSEK